MPDEGRPRPEEYQPPLRWFHQAWRLVVVLLLSGVGWVQLIGETSTLRLVLDLLVGVGALVLVAFRRRWPVPVAVVTALLSSVSSAAAGPSSLALVSLATRRRWREVAAVGVLNFVAAEVYARISPVSQVDPAWLTPVLNLVVMAALIAWGLYIGSRRELMWTLRRRAVVAEAERDMRAHRSRLEERSRIAREMHDVLAHRISAISMHAGALSYRTTLSGDEVREIGGVIRETATLALTDLRGILGVLREDADGVQRSPQPTYGDLADLVEEAREAGMRVRFRDGIHTGTEVPDAAGRTLYRIVQEGLTNARKHAPGADLAIDVDGTPEDGITIELRNPLGFGRSTTPGAGLGLIGLAERAELGGGRLDADRVARDFVLRGWIPWSP
ncbi:sensor histidine kinase [Nocardioides currus]|uniref:sensor histidine kinase n=1 Tax=Nocardioides currus TaxID=2133958 RepID=UPI001A9C7F64|nr:histidine kinase [Nocardioides currus]